MYMHDGEFIKFKRDGKDVAVLIQWDEYPESPREWDNLGTMVCFHNRYRLGDKHNYEYPHNFIADLLRKTMGTNDLLHKILAGMPNLEIAHDGNEFVLLEHYHNIRGEEDICSVANGETKEALMRDLQYRLESLEINTLRSLIDPDKLAILPLYLLDHSGLWMSTSSFYDPWDSGQVGWIYITKAGFLRESGYAKSNWPQRAYEILEGEVKIYNQYLTGEVCGFQEFELDEDGDWIETENSCCGFYGCDIEENGVVDYVSGLAEAIKSGEYETGTAKEHRVTTVFYEF